MSRPVVSRSNTIRGFVKLSFIFIGGKKEFSGSMTDVGNGWCYETDDDERYHKAQKLAEDAVEGEKRSDGRFIEEIAEDYTQQDGNDDSCQ